MTVVANRRCRTCSAQWNAVRGLNHACPNCGSSNFAEMTAPEPSALAQEGQPGQGLVIGCCPLPQWACPIGCPGWSPADVQKIVERISRRSTPGAAPDGERVRWAAAVRGAIEAAYRHGYSRGASDERSERPFNPDGCTEIYMANLPAYALFTLAALSPATRTQEVEHG